MSSIIQKTMALPQQFLPAITVEQYLQLERASEMRHEFLNGLMYAMAGENARHSTVCFNLTGVIGTQIRDKPYLGFSPNLKVRAGSGGLYAYPDLMIVCGKATFQDDHEDVLLNPTVIFEVLSPSTEKYDRGEKFRRYRTQIESLQDYVLVSQDQMRIEHHHRESDDTWTLAEVRGPEGVLSLTSIESQLPLVDAYRNTKAAAK
jgi:Uma2 family endonuclease